MGLHYKQNEDRHAYQKEWKDTSCESSHLNPFFSLEAHQSGVNCLSIQRLNMDQKEGDCFILASGGDDQSLRTLFLAMHSQPSSDPPRPTVRVLANYFVQLAHASSIKCVELFEGRYLFSTGPDQRLNVWEVKTSMASCYDCQIALALVGSYFLDVADIAALGVSSNSLSGNPSLLVIAAGCGMQLLEIEFNGST